LGAKEEVHLLLRQSKPSVDDDILRRFDMSGEENSEDFDFSLKASFLRTDDILETDKAGMGRIDETGISD
jgi:hypothetical protein